ncbi:hypothetical protein SAMN05444266_103244 [Chitinophaga jiangningensis]|uniref:DUF5703 domain-containing protein n=1 Tax=Chitinophaga jiangningensis TaxID=1419482 RepID=A0A1M7AE75_9BACT|nr:DUF5703 domain-containing protein [Chitinophaga jiangningensis]SHL40990.1 hypothetical protein SAMN05444266_103244 [Chitinophaga jiangningensis]
MRTLILQLALLLQGSMATAQYSQNYDITWTTPGENAGASMPCGGGDIGMNIWVEKGDLLVYVARSGSLDENNGLMKTGRLRIKLSPNPFTGKEFRQQLHLREGYVTVAGQANGVRASIIIWADVMQPVAHFQITANKPVAVEAAYENWRYQNRTVAARENFGNSWKWAAPKNNIVRKDSITFTREGVLFYHHNTAKTIFDSTVIQQGLTAVKDSLYNPLRYLAFGGSFYGKGFEAAGTYNGIYANTDFRGWQLRSTRNASRHELTLALATLQTEDLGAWQQQLYKLMATANKNMVHQNREWWQEFWNRSFIETTQQSTWELGRNYQLFRYMLACNANGYWPTKFNGGLFTVDPVYTDTTMMLTPDYRNWGGGLHTAQNQRLVHFPMIKSGDWDLMQPQLNFYLRLLPTAELRSKVYWNHGGACFTEQMENYGLPDFAEYGQKRPDYFDKGVEYNAWLEYEWDTVLEFCLMMLEQERYTGKNIKDYIPFIESCLRFFDEHYQYLAKRRGRHALDDKGKLILYPGSAAETYKMAYNATSTIAALQTISSRLLELPAGYLSEAQKQQWMAFRNRIPDINYTSQYGAVTIAPARSWERINNVESPQLYPVYPWGLFGIGKPGLDTALNTWQKDTNVIRFRSHAGWKQDNIWAARLGLRQEAFALTARKLAAGPQRFPAFWGPGFDWLPDHNWGGSAMIGFQEMLLQTDDKRILLFPGWPADKDVHFKLHAPYNTTVEATLKDGKVTKLVVLPKERQKDVQILLN